MSKLNFRMLVIICVPGILLRPMPNAKINLKKKKMMVHVALSSVDGGKESRSLLQFLVTVAKVPSHNDL